MTAVDEYRAKSRYWNNAFTDLADAAIAELDDQLMEAEQAHGNAARWFEEQQRQFERAKRAEATVERLITQREYYAQFSEDAVRADLARYEEAE